MTQVFVPRVLDLDGSLTHPAQTAWLREANATQLDYRAWGSRLRYLCARDAMLRFERTLPYSKAPALTFCGSGDFHHLTASLLRRFEEPLSLIIFDQHPDWDVTSPWPCCGSWVNEALRMPHVQRVVVIGLGDEDLHGWHLLRGNTRALHEGRLELYPARRHIARDGMGYQRFRTVQQLGMKALIDDVIRRLPTRQIYVSVDKDCLTADWAVTNWQSGTLELPDVTQAIVQLGARCQILGADVTGEWSAGAPHHPLFAVISRADHPSSPHFTPTESQLQTNAITNRAFWKAFTQDRAPRRCSFPFPNFKFPQVLVPA